jgi:hypothetical protein
MAIRLVRIFTGDQAHFSVGEIERTVLRGERFAML